MIHRPHAEHRTHCRFHSCNPPLVQLLLEAKPHTPELPNLLLSMAAILARAAPVLRPQRGPDPAAEREPDLSDRLVAALLAYAHGSCAIICRSPVYAGAIPFGMFRVLP